MCIVKISDLKYKSDYGMNFGQYQEGYRIVYFYPDNHYSVGTFSGDIESFMMDFINIEPIDDDSDIPPFISVDDVLTKYLDMVDNTSAVAIYKTDGTCVQRKERENKISIK